MTKRTLLPLFAAILACLLGLCACGGNGSTSGEKTNGTTYGNASIVTDEEEAPVDASTLNVFTASKTSKNGNAVTVRITLGGANVKLCGFKIMLNFDSEIAVKSVRATKEFEALTYNDTVGGKLVLLWAVTENVEKTTAVCDITFEVGSPSSQTIKPAVESLGDFDGVNFRVKNTTAVFNNFNI